MGFWIPYLPMQNSIRQNDSKCVVMIPVDGYVESRLQFIKQFILLTTGRL